MRATCAWRAVARAADHRRRDVEAERQGVRVALATRCGGRVVPYPAQPFADRAGLSPVKTRLALSLELLGA